MITSRSAISGCALATACAWLTALTSATCAGADEQVSIPRLMLQPSINLVLSVDDVAASKEFLGEVLGLEPMADLHLPGGFVMTRYRVGTTEIKLLSLPTTKKTETGELDAAIGIRRLSLFFPDADALRGRFHAVGLPDPEFETEPGPRGWSRAIVHDPDGNEIELIVPPAGTPEEVFNNIELRLTVADVEKSRQFYREFVQFDELAPLKVPAAEGGELFRFRHGNTTIALASFGPDLPKHAGRWQDAHGMRYIQYIVNDLDAVDGFAKSSGVTIAQPIFPLGKLARIMFIADPDGIINEFVGLPKKPAN